MGNDPRQFEPVSPAWLGDPNASDVLWTAQEYHAAALNAQYQGASSQLILEEMIDFEFAGSMATVSSFGTQSAVLLALMAEVNPSVPVLFIDTGKLFPETLAYRDQLAEQLGLTDVRSVSQTPKALQAHDPHGALWMQDTNTCCDLRKVEPLHHVLTEFKAWVSGRKRFQGASRTELEVFEADGPHIKINPLATWSKEEIDAFAKAKNLPDHPLLAEGYRSVGCAPCTQKTPEGGDDRAGRWAGQEKTECGIHLSYFKGAGI